ncbi:MAG: hypothetical protein ACFFE3_07260 [Candidatus Thorarchaeota archaeon]
MRKFQTMSLILILLIVFPISIISLQSTTEENSNHIPVFVDSNSDVSPMDSEPNVLQPRPYQNIWTTSESHSQVPTSGELDPVLVEQSGFNEADSVFARTDTWMNTEQTLTIDTDHDWVASTAEVELSNLRKIYAVNGTFDDGYPGTNINPTGSVSYHPFGWDASSTTTDVIQTQVASYSLGTESFVTLENQGTPTGPAVDRDYLHSVGTNVTWSQNATNIPYSENFILNFRYYYFRGPIGAVPSGNCSIVVYINGSLAWSKSLLLVDQHGIWVDSGDIFVSRSGIGGIFEIEIGLSIDGTMILDPNTDYDSDGYLDGIQNTFYITTFFDDFSLVSATSPNCNEVNLELTVNGSTTAIIGSSGNGFGQIVNQTYWTKNELEFLITSNTSVSFDYRARLLNHRFINSSWTTDTLQQGVAYTIAPEISGDLELYTYLGFLEGYENLTLRIYHPPDWENITVFDPFLSNVTSSCTLDDDSTMIPTILLDRLGWWKMTCEAPNYAQSAETERYDTGIPGWVNESIFHSFDHVRLSVSIGTSFETPIISDAVNFAWVLPNGTIWSETSSSGGTGSALSAPVVFGPTNTTAGIWGVRYLWSNGSELAYSCYDFTLHHTAILELVFSDTLATVVGQPVTVVLRFLDAENGQYLLNDGASVIGQWAGPDVVFIADVVNNWWQADFDTALVGAGDFVVSLVSAAPYFETVPLEITISSHFLTTLDAPTGPLTPLIYRRDYSFDYFYSMSYNGTGIDEATVEVSEEGSEWASVENTGAGHYNLSLTPMAPSDYSIRIRFSKVGFENQTHVLSFLVNDVPIEIDTISSLVGTELSPFSIELTVVESDTRSLVSDANVTLAVYLPAFVLYYDALMDEISPGVYSISIPMPRAGSGTYTIRISIEKEHHEMAQDFSATLVPLIDTNLRLFEALQTYSGPIGIILVFGIGTVAGQRVRTRRRREKHASAVAIKNRFNDANNILGFLVLHKLSGVPIFSKVFKGGFEEGMLSAFITAIMHFREEIEAGTADIYTLIPISEVIRTVPTEHLICAYITVTSPSVEQEAKMVSYARAIGMMLDETLAMQTGKIIDAKTSKTFEWLFDDLMDGILVRRYQKADKKFPKPLRFIEKAILIEETDGSFDMSRLIRLLTSTHVSVDAVYIHVFRAIEEEYILPVYPHNYENEQFEF